MKIFIIAMLLALGVVSLGSAWAPAQAVSVRIDPNGAP